MIHTPLSGNVGEFEDTTVDDMMSLQIGFIPNRHRKPSSVSNDDTIINLTENLLRIPLPSNGDILYFLNAAASSVHNLMHNALGIPADV